MTDMNDNLKKLQTYEQNMQGILRQKQDVSSQLIEIESALSELGEVNYKIVGNIMVRQDKDKLRKDIEEQKETLNLRLKSLEKQENLIKDKSKEVQEKVLKHMEK
ncbi:prefoldin subunit beta [Candidatus Woesearchaeota archaeon]|nr:prefoldin subunit beta [Candidatus Woesearchaeota archaeon]